MKQIAMYLMIASLAACTWATTGDYDWLNESERTKWIEVTILVLGREVQFEIPEKAHGTGMRTQFMSFVENQELEKPLLFPYEWQSDEFSRIVTFWWDRSWGGFHKASEWDFDMDVHVQMGDSQTNLLAASMEERIDQIRRSEREKAARWGDYKLEWFAEHFRASPFPHPVDGNWASYVEDHSDRINLLYQIPLSKDHVLRYSFFIRKDRMSGPATQQWLDSRRAIARQIMETVSIDPPPF